MASATATASTSATASVATRSRGSPSRARPRVASRPSSAARKSVVASATGPTRSSGQPPAALVVGHDAEETRATADAVSRALGVRVVCLLHDEGEATSRGGLCPSGARLACRPGPFPGSWALVGGTAEDAAVCGADPTSGLVASLGFACVACVVGVAREPCLGEDAAGARATRAGRRAAVTSGVPVVVATVPTTTAEAPVAGARDALERVLRVMRDNAVLPLVAPRNSPRSHFPFPTKDRWASLGTSAFPWPDAEMATRVAGDARDAGDFAAADCWSLGGGASAFGEVTSGGSGASSGGTRASFGDEGRRKGGDDARAFERARAFSLRASLREAFRDGDVFVCVSAPPRWEKQEWDKQGFAACRPGVLWRQERVRAEFHPPGSGSDRDRDRGEPGRDFLVDGDRNRNDAFGRTLPLNALGDVRGSVGEGADDGARFVRQLATERASAANERARSDDGAFPALARSSDAFSLTHESRAPPTGAAPSCFVVGGGVIVADECAGGDVDAVFRKGGGKAAVTTHQTWPAGHPFVMREDAHVEALRPCGETGLPLWLAEEDEEFV